MKDVKFKYTYLYENYKISIITNIIAFLIILPLMIKTYNNEILGPVYLSVEDISQWLFRSIRENPLDLIWFAGFCILLYRILVKKEKEYVLYSRKNHIVDMILNIILLALMFYFYKVNNPLSSLINFIGLCLIGYTLTKRILIELLGEKNESS